MVAGYTTMQMALNDHLIPGVIGSAAMLQVTLVGCAPAMNRARLPPVTGVEDVMDGGAIEISSLTAIEDAAARSSVGKRLLEVGDEGAGARSKVGKRLPEVGDESIAASTATNEVGRK